MAEPPLRLLNFVTESELAAERDDGAASPRNLVPADDRPLFEILKENKDKKDAEFSERFKHQPPKALDEDETEFLEALETYKKQQEQEAADDEARQLTDFQTAIANRTIAMEEARPLVSASPPIDPQLDTRKIKRSQLKPAVPSFIKIKPQSKKAKKEETLLTTKPEQQVVLAEERIRGVGLVSYSDESDDDEPPQK